MNNYKKTLKTKLQNFIGKGFKSVTLSVIISVLFVTTLVTAATTINENINTAGTLTVTGTSALATTTIASDLTVDTDTLYVDSVNGRVGIGTTSPSEKLDINGDVKISLGSLMLDNNAYIKGYYNGSYGSIIGTDSSGYTILKSPSSGIKIQSLGGSNRVIFYNDGKSLLQYSSSHPSSEVLKINYDYAIDSISSNGGNGAFVSRYSTALTSGVEDTGQSGHVVGVKGEGWHNGSGYIGGILGAEGAVQNSGGGSVNRAISVEGYFQGNDTNGQIDNYYGFYSASSGLNSGNIDRWIDFYSPDINSGGSGTIVNRYSLLNEDEDKIISTMGNVGIGTTTPATKLDVDGVIKTAPRASATCDGNSEGGIYYDSDDSNFYGCNGTTWIQLNN
ncbi:hypothetical protein KJ603_02165 [Patescibacteria group bacterium]|nr:hypothetical protein [Patescibacteria group bacterium]